MNQWIMNLTHFYLGVNIEFAAKKPAGFGFFWNLDQQVVLA